MEGRLGDMARLTGFPAENFFSVPTMAPLRCAAFRADLPRTTVSFCDAPPVTLLPILVTVSQSSMMLEDLSLLRIERWMFLFRGLDFLGRMCFIRFL